MAPQITDQDRLNYDLFAGEDGELSCRTVVIRTAQKEHPCFGGLGRDGDGHTIKPGERYRHERAFVDRSFWGEYRICLRCLDKELSELMGEDDDDE